MRFLLGSPPLDETFHPDEEGWVPLREPGPLLLNVLAVPFGVCAAIVLHFGWERPGQIQLFDEGSGLGRLLFAFVLAVGLAVVLLAVVTVHELIHAFAYPYFGLTRATVIGFWPSRMLFYAGYQRGLRRDRWLIVYVLPFLVLSIAPLAAYHGLGVPTAQSELVGLWPTLYFLSLLNGLMSGGDLLYVLLIMLQVPRRAVMQNHGWATWWKPPP